MKPPLQPFSAASEGGLYIAWPSAVAQKCVFFAPLRLLVVLR
jgi:hypothetical protein